MPRRMFVDRLFPGAATQRRGCRGVVVLTYGSGGYARLAHRLKSQKRYALIALALRAFAVAAGRDPTFRRGGRWARPNIWADDADKSD